MTFNPDHHTSAKLNDLFRRIAEIEQHLGLDPRPKEPPPKPRCERCGQGGNENNLMLCEGQWVCARIDPCFGRVAAQRDAAVEAIRKAMEAKGAPARVDPLWRVSMQDYAIAAERVNAILAVLGDALVAAKQWLP